jgi:hypothetical protein
MIAIDLPDSEPHVLGLDEVPCIVLAHLTPTQRRAYVLADASGL